jgi:hypothetical protein
MVGVCKRRDSKGDRAESMTGTEQVACAWERETAAKGR